MGFGWDYPPGVTGREPQISGEWPCENCGTILPEEADCPECGKPMEQLHIKDDPEHPERYVWKCNESDGCEHESPGDSCPGGCDEGPDPDRQRDEAFDRAQRNINDDF